jgi:glycosyltransferase involved in cell wall biosynthesis
MATPHISVCICTFRRLELLTRLFAKLALQKTDSAFTFSVAVVDNDKEGSAQATVLALAKQYNLPTAYEIEPQRNFASVRNRIVRLAKGDYIAFIDDDEVPVDEWLLNLWTALLRNKADGALGPVRPYYDETPPRWLVKSRLTERPALPTDLVLNWNQTRTGNVLLAASIFNGRGIRFDERFASGGEDVDFFKRSIQNGCRFVWCEEAPAYELVPTDRLRRSYYIRRALLQGANTCKYADHRMKLAVKSFLGIFIYSLALPFLALAGQHLFVRYLVKECNHIGTALALLGFQPIGSRDALVKKAGPESTTTLNHTTN